MDIRVNNANLLIIPILIIILIGLISVVIIKKFNRQQLKIVLIFQLSFIVTYFPIMEYWSIWNFSVWPDGFSFPYSSSFKFKSYTLIFNFLNWTSIILFYSSVILFISDINKSITNRRTQILNWIPFINIISIPNTISKTLNKKPFDSILLGLWLTILVIWLFYRFIGLILCFLGLDIYSSTIGLFLEQNGTSNISSLTGCADIMNILTPPILYVSGIISILLTFKIIKSTGASTQ